MTRPTSTLIGFGETIDMRLKKLDIALCVFAIVYMILWTLYIPRVCLVCGISMEPTLHDGQYLLTIRPLSIDRMDIVTIKTGSEDGTIMKRVIGLPGDTVHIHDGRVYVNNKPVDDIPTELAGTAYFPLTLGEDEYYVLGDNRAVSKDSRNRFVGPIKQEQIYRKVVTSK